MDSYAWEDVLQKEHLAQDLLARQYRALNQSCETERLGKSADCRPADVSGTRSRHQDRHFRNSLRKRVELRPCAARTRPRSAARPRDMHGDGRVPWLAAEWAKTTGARTARERAQDCQSGLQKTWSPFPRREVPAVPPAPPAVLRCRLLGRAETAALRVPGWQECLGFELTDLLVQLMGLPAEAFAMRIRHKGHRVSVQLSFSSHVTPGHLELLREGLADGSLRRLALRSSGMEKSWPVSQALRQFLLRDIAFEAFWILERHEWRVANCFQALQRPSVILASQPFNLAEGQNLTLHLHANSQPGLSVAALTLSAAGYGRPTSSFLLSAGGHGEVWTGPYGRDGAHRFLAGGPLCTCEELQMLVDNEKTLVLAVEAVQSEAPEWLPGSQASPQQAPCETPQTSRRPEAPVKCRPMDSRCDEPEAEHTSPEASPSAAQGAALLAAVETASKCVEAMDASAELQEEDCIEMIRVVSTAQKRVEDLAGRMSALERALLRRARPQAARPPAPEDEKSDQLITYIQLAGEHLAWHVELETENSDSPRCLFHESLASKLSTSTADFKEED